MLHFFTDSVTEGYHSSYQISSSLVISKANKILGVLKRTRTQLHSTQLKHIKTRRTLYLSLVKSQLCYVTEVWSPVNNVQLSKRIERAQCRATGWIMMSRRGELSYKDRLLALDLLPLTFDRKVKDVVILYKALFGYVNVDVCKNISFVSHGRTRLSNTSKYYTSNSKCPIKKLYLYHVLW